MSEIFVCNRPAVLLHAIVAFSAIAYLFQHLFGEYMLWLAHGTPNLVLVNLQAALPIATVAVLLWSARRPITRAERLIASLLMTSLGAAYMFLMTYSVVEMRLVSLITGLACILLAVGLVVGEFYGYEWLLHPWSRDGGSGGRGGGGKSSSFVSAHLSHRQRESDCDAITQSFVEGP